MLHGQIQISYCEAHDTVNITLLIKVKVPVLEHHAIESCVNGYKAPCILNFGTRCGRVVTFTAPNNTHWIEHTESALHKLLS
jgi:hypothetical protein